MKLNFVEEGADLVVLLHAGNIFKRTVENGTVTITNETEDLEKLVCRISGFRLRA